MASDPHSKWERGGVRQKSLTILWGRGILAKNAIPSTFPGFCYHQIHRQSGDIILGLVSSKRRDNEMCIRPEKVGFDTSIRVDRCWKMADVLVENIPQFHKQLYGKQLQYLRRQTQCSLQETGFPECSLALFSAKMPISVSCCHPSQSYMEIYFHLKHVSFLYKIKVFIEYRKL